MSAPVPAGGAATAEAPVVILAAMRAEVAPLVRRLVRRERLEAGSCRAWRGWLGGTPVVVAHTGEGAVRAEAGTRALCERLRPRLAVVVGIAGGLSPGLRPGDLVVAREVRDTRGGVPAPDRDWVERLARLGGAALGTVVSSETILARAAAKAAVGAELAGSEPATVDLESAAFAHAAARHGVPYVVVRAVCDAADEDLPLDLERCRDGSGAIRRAGVVRQALRHPSSARELWRLRQRLGRGAASLARLVEGLLAGAERRP